MKNTPIASITGKELDIESLVKCEKTTIMTPPDFIESAEVLELTFKFEENGERQEERLCLLIDDSSSAIDSSVAGLIGAMHEKIMER